MLYTERMELLGALLASLALISILGIIIAFSPTLIITELTILTRSKNPVIQSIAFIAGIGLAIALFCFVAIALFDPNRQIVIPSTHDIIKSVPILDIIIGLLFIAVSFTVAKPKPTPVAKPSRFKAEKLLSTKTLLWFGFIKMATSLSSIAAILLATRYIMSSVDTSTLRFASVIWLIGVAVLPFVLILLLEQYRPESFAKIQYASDRAVSLNWRRVIACTLVIAGGYFILSGVLNLT